MKKVLKIGGYVRVSHEEQKKFGYSINAQIEEIEKWCETNNHQLYKLYIDEGFSASTMKRPQLQEMLNDLPKLDVIVFTRLDRLSRNVFEANTMLNMFKKSDTDMIAICEENVDTRTSNGMFLFNLKVTLAQHELDRGSERIRAVFEYKVREGQPVTGSLPMGYKIIEENGVKKIIKDEKTEHIVNDLFEYFSIFRSVRATCIYINKKYDLTKDYKSYSRLLKRELYTGKYKTNPNYVPAYITEEQYLLNQEYIKNNIRIRGTKNVYLFPSLMKCPRCGWAFGGRYNDGNHRSLPGRRYYSYSCNKRKMKSGCGFVKHISELKLEKYLLDNIEQLVKEHIASVPTNVEKLSEPEKDVTKKRIKEIKSELENLTYAFRKNRISLKQYDLEYDELEKELKKLNASLTSTRDLTPIKQFLNSDWKEIYNGLEKVNKRALWHSVIDEIILDEDMNIKVVFK